MRIQTEDYMLKQPPSLFSSETSPSSATIFLTGHQQKHLQLQHPKTKHHLVDLGSTSTSTSRPTPTLIPTPTPIPTTALKNIEREESDYEEECEDFEVDRVSPSTSPDSIISCCHDFKRLSPNDANRNKTHLPTLSVTTSPIAPICYYPKVTLEEAIKVLKKLMKWAGVESLGSPIANTRIIPCKTPIDNHWIASFEEKEHQTLEGKHKNFSFRDLQSTLDSQNTPLGLIVDISNHTPLYDITGSNVQYVKVACISKQVCDIESVRKLQQITREFYANPQNDGKYIAIHCSYGKNRTGVMIVSYLIEEYGMSFDDALQAFRIARPPGIHHDYMVQELRERYHNTNSPSSSPPSMMQSPSSP